MLDGGGASPGTQRRIARRTDGSSASTCRESAPLLDDDARIGYQTLDGIVGEGSEVKRNLSSFIVQSVLNRIRIPLANDTSQPKQPEHFAGVFTEKPESHTRNGPVDKKAEKDHEKKIRALTERLRLFGVDNITESNIDYALHHVTPEGDPEAAFKLLWLLEDTYIGIVKPYDPSVKLAGAVNKAGVSCYLDALLFGMFVQLDSFEAMLYENYTDPRKKRLGALLRLWVNMIRSGLLITTDITAHIQDALADCGWTDATQNMQQDASEAFTFITGQLELPMLTLKMDMFHTGKEDPHDDHKFVNERLLEVAILDKPVDGRSVITLEDCLEHYFNNRIEVKRHLENQRRNTLKSGQPPLFFDGYTKADKEPGTHIEVAEVPETPVAASPTVATPATETPKTPAERLRPTSGRRRQDSIFSQRKVELVGIDPEALTKTDSNLSQQGLPGRKLSTRTEVLMPAWQFFKLLPWYTENMPTTDAQVAAHFSRQRPILGICLKRYSYTNEGSARKRDDFVDIPLEITVPNFVGGDEIDGAAGNNEQVGGNFRLMLQAVVCHRGVSVHSGHYVCLCRSKSNSSQSRRGSAESEEPGEDSWMLFDDLAPARVTDVDIHDAMKKESPYLVFYQVQPIGEDTDSMLDHQLPSYTEATSQSQGDTTPLEKPYVLEPSESNAVLDHVMSDPLSPTARPSTEVTDWEPATERSSTDASSALDLQRGRTGASTSDKDLRRKSVTLDASSFSGSAATDNGSIKTDPKSNSVPSTPSEEKASSSNNTAGGFLNVAKSFTGSRRGSKVSGDEKKKTAASRSRPTSTEGTKRLSLNMTKLAQRMSKGQGSTVPPPTADDVAVVPEIVPSEAVVAGEGAVTAEGGEKASFEDGAGEVGRVAVAQPPQVLPKGKKERKKLKAQAPGQGGKGEEERECVIM